jgi:anti-sigma factor RsiW
MSDKHWSDDDLVARLFGLGPEDTHLDTCELCSRRWKMIRQRHEVRHAAETEVPGELLAAQRRAIYARLEQNPRKSRVSWVHSLAAALLLVLVVFTVFKPAAQKQAIDAVSEDEALEDVFRVASRTEPAPVGPVKFLFEVQE